MMTAEPRQEASPGVERLADDAWLLRIPLADHSVNHANVYALRAERKILLIDCGWSSTGCRVALQAMLGTFGATIADVSHVLLTHSHADHCGLAGDLQREAGSTIFMHPADAAQLHDRFVDHHQLRIQNDAWISAIGAPEAASRVSISQQEELRSRFAPMVPDILVDSGWTIEHGRFKVSAIHTPGHTPGHLCFLESTEQVLFTGDTVMPRINYSAAFRPFGDADPLARHEESLRLLLQQDARRGLPGHQEVYHDPAGRIHQLLNHQERRSGQVLDMVGSAPDTAWQLASRVSRRRPWTELPVKAQLSAAGEMMAYLIRLGNSGVIAEDPMTHSWRRA